MKAIVVIAILVIGHIAAADETQDVMQSIAQSHIDGNVPAKEAFTKLLNRDLSEYLSTYTGKKIEAQYELLRDVPTQTGIAYPKFYVWVRGAGEDKKTVTEGVARVAAVEKTRFEVTHYITKDDIVSRPEIVELNFPAALLPKIREKAGVKN